MFAYVNLTSPLFKAPFFCGSLYFRGEIESKKSNKLSENIVQWNSTKCTYTNPNESSVSDPSKPKSAIKSKPGNKISLNVVINSVDIESGKGSISFFKES